MINLSWAKFLILRAKVNALVMLIGFILISIAVTAFVDASANPLHGPHHSHSLAASNQDELQIQLRDNGFSPSEVQHPAGTFAIAVENSVISGEYTLRLKAADGTVIKEVQVQKGSAAWTVTLSAGEYTLTEASHPQWLCRITVQ